MTDLTPAPGDQADPDGYKGLSWRDRAALPSLGAVLDPADTRGYKNRYLDSIHRQTIRAELHRLMRERSGRFKRAMDFGCGTGRMLGELVEVAEEVVGVDRTQEMIERARQLGVVPPERLIVWREGDLPFEAGSIDLMMSVYVMMTPETLDIAAAAWPRVCSQTAVGLLIEQVDRGRGLTLERYADTLKKAGFRIVLTRPIRRGARSPFQRVAGLAPWPPSIVDALAWMEMTMVHRSPRADRPGYVDYAILIQRDSSSDMPS